jgi:hypothetical protein
VAGPARRRKTPAEPLEPSWNEVSVGCAASDFCSTRRKLPPANIEKPKLGFIQRFPKRSKLPLLLLLPRSEINSLTKTPKSSLLSRKVQHFSSATRRTFQPPFTVAQETKKSRKSNEPATAEPAS